MDSSLDWLQRSIPSLRLSLGSALSLIFLAIAFICVVKRSLRKRFPPGPSGWPVIGSLPLLGNMPHHSLYQLSKQYGPIMYLKLGTTDTVVVSSPKIAEACLKTNDLNFSNRPDNSTAKYIGYHSNGLVWAPYGPRWRMMRKICNIHLFGSKALDDLQPVREEEVGMMVKSILEHERQGKAVNLGKVLNICAANVLGQIMLSKRVFDFQGHRAGEFRQLVVEQTDLAGKFIIGDFVSSLAWMDPQGVRTKMKKLHIRIDEFISKMIEEHQTASCNGGMLNCNSNCTAQGSFGKPPRSPRTAFGKRLYPPEGTRHNQDEPRVPSTNTPKPFSPDAKVRLFCRTVVCEPRWIEFGGSDRCEAARRLTTRPDEWGGDTWHRSDVSRPRPRQIKNLRGVKDFLLTAVEGKVNVFLWVLRRIRWRL